MSTNSKTVTKGALGKERSTRAALRAAVQRAVRRLEENLDEPPAVAELARAAGVSNFHFQRAFQEVVGETVAQHSLRLRVERAASLLKHSSWQIGEIALTCGFQTQSSFGRSFKKIYGITPRQFRNERGAVPFVRGYARSRPNEELGDSSVPVPTVVIDQWSDLTAVCLRFYGPVSGTYKAWAELLKWARKAVPDLESARFLGLWFDDWDADEERCRYECAIVPTTRLAEPPPDPFHLRTIEAGRVALAHAHGRTGDLERAWKAFGAGWLPFSGYQPRGEFVIDEYPAEVALGSPARKISTGLLGMSMRMCLPVQEGPVLI